MALQCEATAPGEQRIQFPVGTIVRWICSQVLVRFYYPAAIVGDGGLPTKERAHWIASPQALYVRGYSRFLGIDFRPVWWTLRCLFGSIRMEAYPDLSPATERRWPVVILSHGLGGTATAYAKLCCALSAHGMVVLAVEHQDGTASATLTRSGTALFYRKPNLRDPVGKRKRARKEQLEKRCREIQTLLEWLQGTEPATAEEDRLQLELLKVCDAKRITLCGHSFGGATIAQWLLSPRADQFSLHRCLLLDPWFWPLLNETEIENGNEGRREPTQEASSLPLPTGAIAPSLLLVNELFSRSLSPTERRALQLWPATHRLMLRGAAHQVQSDFEHRLPRIVTRFARLASRQDPSRLFQAQLDLIIAFLDGDEARWVATLEREADLVVPPEP